MTNVEFDTNAMDNALYKDDLDWSFDKPEGEYSVVYVFKKEKKEMNPQVIIKKMNEYVDEPLNFDDFDWDGFLNWNKLKVFEDLDELCDWCVSTLEEDGAINWTGHMEDDSNALSDFINNNDFYIIDMDDWEESEPMTFKEAIKGRLEKMEEDENARWEICWTEKGESFEPNEIDSHEIWRESEYSEWIQNVYFGDEEF